MGKDEKRGFTSAAGERTFLTTQWSLVSIAKADCQQSREALAVLCENYWLPLYAFVRRSGLSPHDAQDTTQAFFQRLLESNSLQAADRGRGRFRSFLLACLKNFMSHQRAKSSAQKRGGGKRVISLDFEQAEGWYQNEPAVHRTPEREYERRWALSVLDRVVLRLEAEYAQSGRQRLLDVLKGYLAADSTTLPYADAAASLQMTAGSVRVAAHRLRRRYRQLLEDEIRQTLADPDDVEQELGELLAALSGRA